MTFASDVRALVRKDWWLTKKHRIATALELLFPIFLAYSVYILYHSMGQHQGNDSPITFNFSASGGQNSMSFFATPSSLADTAAMQWLHARNRSGPVDKNNSNDEWQPLVQYSAGQQQALQWMAGNFTTTAQYNKHLIDFLTLAATTNGVGNTSFLNVTLLQAGLYIGSGPVLNTAKQHWDDETGALTSSYAAPLALSELLWRFFNIAQTSAGSWSPSLDVVCKSGCTVNGFQRTATIGTMILPIALLPTVAMVAGRLTDEAVSGVRDHLFTLGVSRLGYLVAHLITALTRLVPFSTMLVAIIPLARPGHVTVPELLLCWFALILFMLALTGISAISPSLFKRPALAMTMVFIVGGLLSGAAAYASEAPPAAFVLVTMFVPSVAFLNVAATAIGQGAAELPVPLAVSLALLIVQTVVYTLLVQCFQHRSNLADLFPFLRGARSAGRIESDLLLPVVQYDSANKSGPQKSSDVVSIRGLTKRFGKVTVVNDVALEVRKGEILSLIGPNGAGKSTTIAMLTGVLPPTTATELRVDGCDVRTDVEGARRGMSVCPQHDVLFGDLSATQHLKFIAELKGQNGTSRVDELLAALSLPTDAKVASAFSGGMKRRLSVACSLVSGSPLVLLDEPTSGLDPQSRRELWDLLLAEKERGTSILLTTHFMEEAELLGDRIAILARGHMICCGTATELKQRYGEGFFVSFAKSLVTPFDSRGLLALLHRHCPEARLERESLGAAVYLLPASALPRFGDVFADVEMRMQSLGATAYGVALASLEDVFVSIAEERDAKTVDGDDRRSSSDVSEAPTEALFAASTYSDHFIQDFVAQTATVLRVRSRRIRGSCWAWLFQLLVPVFVVVVGLTVAGFIKNGFGGSDDNTFLPIFNATKPVLYDFNVSRLNLMIAGDLQNPVIQTTLSRAQTFYTMLAPRFFPEMSAAFAITPPSLSFTEISKLALDSRSFVPMHSLLSSLTSYMLPTLILSVGLSNDGATPQFGYTSQFLANADYRAFILMDHVLRLASAQPATSVNTPNMTLNLDLSVEVLNSSAANSGSGDVGDATPGSSSSSSNEMNVDDQCTLGILICVFIASILATSSAGLSVVDELNRGVFDVLRVHGMGSAAYWVASWIVGMAPYPVIFGSAIIGAAVIGIPAWVDPATVIGALGLFLAASSACLLLAFVLPTLLRGRSAVTYFSISLALGMAQMMTFSGGGVVLNISGLALPLTSYLYGGEQVMMSSCRGEGVSSVFVALSITLWNLLPALLLVLFSSGVFSRRRAMPEAVPTTPEGEDVDVAAERNRVVSSDAAADVARVIGLRHSYDGRTAAVGGISFGLRPGECFGLLGQNGAGKTTTIKALLMDIAQPSAGRVSFLGVGDGLRREAVYRQARLGVCAQHDTLWSELTAREHLEVYLRLRLGHLYRTTDWASFIEDALRVAELGGRDAGRPVGEFSGGMKRKLATSLAANTGARIAVLDEPSTGMDPRARRALWKSISRILQQPDRCVLLTTHSMEEADAVCARIAIARNGYLCCLGNATYLKHRFGAGYRILLQRATADDEDAGQLGSGEEKGADTQAIVETMRTLFGPQCELAEEAGSTLQFSVPSLPSSVAQAFRMIGERQQQLGVSFFCVESASLEDVFLKMTRTAS